MSRTASATRHRPLSTTSSPASRRTPRRCASRAGSCSSRGRTRRRSNSIQAAIKADPKDPASYLALAALQRAAGRPEAAEAAIDAGLAAVPGNPLLLLNHADQLTQQGDHDGALAAFEKLYALRPNSVIAANNLASLLSEQFARDPQKLARAAEVARPLAGVENPQVQDTYGWIQYLQGKPDEALRSLIPAAQGLPENPWVRYHIGMAYAALGQTDEAKSNLQAALQLGGGQSFPADQVRAELDRLGTLQ